MKKIAFLLALCLLLTGCAQGDIPEQTGTETPDVPQVAEEPVAQHLPDNPESQASGGALEVYSLIPGQYSFLPLTDGVLLFVQETENTRLFLLRGEDLTVAAETVVTGFTAPLGWTEKSGGNGFAHYDHENKCYRIYDGSLQMTRQIDIPAQYLQNACISGDFRTVYYSTGTDLMAYDAVQNLPRPLRVGGEGTKNPLGLCADDTMLLYDDLLPDRTDFYLIDTATGQQIQTLSGQLVWRTDGERYYCLVEPNVVQFAPFGGKMQELRLGDTAVIADMTDAGLILASEGTTLSIYDTASGKKTAQITLPEAYAEVIAQFAPGKDGVWILGQGSLLYWDYALSSTQDDTVYTGKVK